MSKVKNYFENMIADLAEKTSYTFEFLLERFNEVMDEDGDIDYFVGVTLERDW